MLSPRKGLSTGATGTTAAHIHNRELGWTGQSLSFQDEHRTHLRADPQPRIVLLALSSSLTSTARWRLARLQQMPQQRRLSRPKDSPSGSLDLGVFPYPNSLFSNASDMFCMLTPTCS